MASSLACGRGLAKYRTGGRRAPAGSLYRPRLISVIGWTTRSPCARHQRNSSPLCVGRRKPGPGKAGAAPISASRSSVASPTAWPKKPTPVAQPVTQPSCSTTVATPLPDRVQQLPPARVAVHLDVQRVARGDIPLGGGADGTARQREAERPPWRV